MCDSLLPPPPLLAPLPKFFTQAVRFISRGRDRRVRSLQDWGRFFGPCAPRFGNIRYYKYLYIGRLSNGLPRKGPVNWFWVRPLNFIPVVVVRESVASRTQPLACCCPLSHYFQLKFSWRSALHNACSPTILKTETKGLYQSTDAPTYLDSNGTLHSGPFCQRLASNRPSLHFRLSA